MSFLAQYGLFALKSITLVIALLLLLAGIAAVFGKKPKPRLSIESLNHDYDELKQQLNKDIKGKKAKDSKVSKKEKKARQERPSLFVINFHGDMKASQVEQLREEITAVLAIAEARDEVLILLESPGGLVNSYGLAASQLQRVRDRNIPLTVCIDKVAASGGYLMSCVANRIVAAPFAIIGSIGVVAQIPNVHRWLKKNDIDVELITAGEYKRTITMLGENTEKGRQKFKEDLEAIHQAFRNYVVANRQQLDIDKVSTGEHWLAVDAFGLRLVDAIKTSDDYLVDKMDTHNIWKISKHHKLSVMEKLLKPAARLMQSGLNRLGFSTL
ncbi:protease SohB [Legionella sp. CNM-4043-24]|uniref:protease SohB n=1 Tax=Legionella sp. CNM-4043-24 TaxID=3421646 RepID=UPI00403A9770